MRVIRQIAVLYSIINDHNQPSNNLVAWWLDIPGLQVLSDKIKEDCGWIPTEAQLEYIRIGTPQIIGPEYTEYRLEMAMEG